VGPRAVLDAVMKRKIPSPRRASKPRTPIVRVFVKIPKNMRSCWSVCGYLEHKLDLRGRKGERLEKTA
jgi:hypothetical protein